MTTFINTVFIHNPLEQFEIKEFFYMGGPLLGAKFSLTNIGLYLIIVTFLVFTIKYLISFHISYLAKTSSLGLRLTANMIDLLILVFIISFYVYLDTANSDSILYSFIPIIVYSNAETDKLLILSENKGKSGIYLWTHNETGRVYVGSAIDLSKRLEFYYSPLALKRLKNYISRALISHGYSAFSLTILEYIDIIGLSKEDTRKLILEREQNYINLIFSEAEPNTYNILKVAGSNLGFTHSDETKALIGLAQSKFDRAGEKNPFYGKIHSPENLVKFSEAKSGKNNPMFGRIGELNPMFGKIGEDHPRSKKVFVYSFDSETQETVLFKSFNTCSDAALYFECKIITISRYLDKNKLYKKQWLLFSSLIIKE